jgi:hypothetical protein
VAAENAHNRQFWEFRINFLCSDLIRCHCETISSATGLPGNYDAIEESIVSVIGAGCRTYDIMEAGTTLVGTSEMGDRIAAQVAAH